MENNILNAEKIKKKKEKINTSNRGIVKDNYGYLFIAPFFIVFAIFVFYPMVYTLILSFKKWDGSLAPAKFVALANFKRLIHDPMFGKSILNTWIMWTANFIPQLIFALGLAAVLTDKAIKGKEIFRSIYYLPNLVTMASVGSLFSFILDWRTGYLNKMLMSLHIIKQPVNWLQSIPATRGAVSYTLWWMWFGYTMIIFMAGIKSIPNDMFEAAYVDGANKRQVFFNITLPLLQPTILYNVVTSIIGGLTMFDIPFVLSGGQGAPQYSVNTMVMYLYNTAFINHNMGYGASIGVGLFIMIFIFVFLAFKLLNKKAVYD